MPKLEEMTNAELKQFISVNRNDRESFEAAMAVVMTRRNPANIHPFPLDLQNAEVEIEAILREKLNGGE